MDNYKTISDFGERYIIILFCIMAFALLLIPMLERGLKYYLRRTPQEIQSFKESNEFLMKSKKIYENSKMLNYKAKEDLKKRTFKSDNYSWHKIPYSYIKLRLFYLPSILH